MPKDINVFEKKLEEQPVRKAEVLHQSDIPAGILDQRHLSGNLKVVEFGTSRPDGSSDIRAYFNTSSGVLSMWTGVEWLTTTLT